MEINEYFGTLQQSIVSTWRDHLESSEHSEHVILDEFYDEFPEKVDKLIEDYMGIFGKVEDYKNIIDPDGMTPVEYLEKLREHAKSGKELLKGESELESDLDDILGFIDSTLYKLKELVKECIRLEDFIKESLNR